MNPRRVHELMRKHFPPVERAAREWIVVHRERGVDEGAIASLLAEHITSTEVLVEVHRKLGGLMPVADAPAYVARHFTEGETRIASRQFDGFVVVALNGVATGWRHSGKPLAT